MSDPKTAAPRKVECQCHKCRGDRRILAAPQPEPSEDQVRRDAITADQRWAQGYAAGRAAGLRALPSAGLDVERLGFTDLLAIGQALLEHYPPDTIVCSHSIKADIGARTVAAIRDLIDSCSARLTTTEDTP